MLVRVEHTNTQYSTDILDQHYTMQGHNFFLILYLHSNTEQIKFIL